MKLTAAVLLALVGAASATHPAPHQHQKQGALQVPVDADTQAAEVSQLKALLNQIETDHGRQPSEAKLETEAKAVLSNLSEASEVAAPGKAAPASSEESSSEESSAAAAESSEESSSEESSSEESSSEESSSEESSAAAPGKSLAELQTELAELVVKKQSGAVRGEDLEALNIQIELIVAKINKLKAAPPAALPKKERTPLQAVTDPLLAHLAQARGDFNAIDAVDVQDVASLARRLAALADAFVPSCQSDNSCQPKQEQQPQPCAVTDSCHVAPEIKDDCAQSNSCEKKVVVEAEEATCEHNPCLPQHTVVAQTCHKSNATDCHAAATVKPTVVDNCSSSHTNSSCAAQSKSVVSTCDACHKERTECHSACESKPDCHATCAAKADSCNKCSSDVVRTDAVHPTTSTAESSSGCAANAPTCANVKPTTVAKGSLTDKKAAKFFFFF